MNEKTMVSDALSEMNASLLSYAYFIEQTSDETLRNKIINSRNDTEAKQYELYKIAKKHGYYQPAAPAQPQEVEKPKKKQKAKNHIVTLCFLYITENIRKEKNGD